MNDSKVFEVADEAMWNVHGGRRTWLDAELQAGLAATEVEVKRAIAGTLDEHVESVDNSYATAIRDAMLAVGKLFEARP